MLLHTALFANERMALIHKRIGIKLEIISELNTY